MKKGRKEGREIKTEKIRTKKERKNTLTNKLSDE